MCISTTNGSIRASTSSGWWTTRSGPSAMIVRSSSVTIVAISTITSRRVIETRSSPDPSTRARAADYVPVARSTEMDRWRDDASDASSASPASMEHCELRSPFGFMAYHGGALEREDRPHRPAAADAAGASLYVVDAARPDPAHFPSIHVRRAESPALHAFFEHVDVVVTVHGYGRDGLFTSLLLGGRNRRLADARRRRAAPPPCRPTRSSPTSTRSPRAARPASRQPGQPAAPTAACRSSCRRACRGLGPRWADWTGDGFVPPAAALVDALAPRRDLVVATVSGARRSSLLGVAAGVRRSATTTRCNRCRSRGPRSATPPTSVGGAPSAPADRPTTAAATSTSVAAADRRLGRRPLRRRDDHRALHGGRPTARSASTATRTPILLSGRSTPTPSTRNRSPGGGGRARSATCGPRCGRSCSTPTSRCSSSIRRAGPRPAPVPRRRAHRRRRGSRPISRCSRTRPTSAPSPR